MRIVSFVDEGLGHSSYLIDLDNATALVVDPARLPSRHHARSVNAGHPANCR